MQQTGYNYLNPVLQLSNDDFLSAFNTSFQVLGSDMDRNSELRLPEKLPKDDNVRYTRILCNLIENSIQENTSPEELEATLLSSGLQKERSSLLVSQLDQLKELLATRKHYGEALEELIDLQWKFGVVAGSSVKEEAGRTFVQVKLVSRSSENVSSSRHIEMTLEKFYDFLHQLEKAKASLDLLTPY